MKSVLISIRPKWCELIASGKKTVEVRKTRPKIETPFKCYIYQTVDGRTNSVDVLENNLGKVIGEFICDEITSGFWISPFSDYTQNQSCLSYDKLYDYANGKPIFAWHISDLVIYDKPKELKEFVTVDKEAIRKCKHRSQSYYSFTNTGYVKNGFICNEKDDWCFGCKRKPIVRPPQSWCYVEELRND